MGVIADLIKNLPFFSDEEKYKLSRTSSGLSEFAPKIHEGRQFANVADAQTIEPDPVSYDVLTGGLGAAKFAAVTPAMHWGKVANQLENVLASSPMAEKMVRSVRDEMPRRANPKLTELIQPERIMKGRYLPTIYPEEQMLNPTSASTFYNPARKELPRFFFGRDAAWTVPHEFFHGAQAGYRLDPQRYSAFADTEFFPIPGIQTGRQLESQIRALHATDPWIFARGVTQQGDYLEYPYLLKAAQGQLPIRKQEDEIMADLAAASYFGEPWVKQVAPQNIQDAIRRVYIPGSLGDIFGRP